jgi:hypothetical protein
MFKLVAIRHTYRVVIARKHTMLISFIDEHLFSKQTQPLRLELVSIPNILGILLLPGRLLRRDSFV